MKKILFIAISLLLSLTFMLSGCEFVWYYDVYLENPKTTDSEYFAVDEGDPREEEPLSGTLELQLWTNESELQEKVWRQIIEKFEEVTGVTVIAHIGSQVNTQMDGRWRDGNPPDVVSLAGSGIPDIAWENSGVVEDLSDIVNEGYVYGVNKKIKDVVYTDMFGRTSEDAGYYRMATSGSVYGLFYDRNTLAQYGVTAPKNYNELVSFVEQAKQKGVAAFTTNGASGGYTTWALVIGALASYGQEFLDGILLGKSASWGSEQTRKILKRLEDFSKMDGAFFEGTTGFDHTTAHIKWLSGKALLCGDGNWLPWEVRNITPEGFEMEFINSPLIDEGVKPSAMVYTSGMMVASKAKNMPAAKAFIRFLYTKYAQQVSAAAEGYIPARKDLTLDELPGLSNASRKILDYLLSDEIDLTFRRYLWGDLNEEINGVIQRIMTGSITADDAIKQIQARSVR